MDYKRPSGPRQPAGDEFAEWSKVDLFAALVEAIEGRRFPQATKLRRALRRRGYTVVPEASAFKSYRAGGDL